MNTKYKFAQTLFPTGNMKWYLVRPEDDIKIGDVVLSSVALEEDLSRVGFGHRRCKNSYLSSVVAIATERPANAGQLGTYIVSFSANWLSQRKAESVAMLAEYTQGKAVQEQRARRKKEILAQLDSMRQLEIDWDAYRRIAKGSQEAHQLLCELYDLENKPDQG